LFARPGATCAPGRGPVMEAEALTSYAALDDGYVDDSPAANLAVSDTRSDAKTFRDFGISEGICAALEANGITTAFPIQALTLPIALDGHDLIGQARTGTGKTLAFGIPILEQLGRIAREPSAPGALVVVPTRELAIQVGDDLRTAGAGVDARIVTLYGGRAYEPQIDALASVDVVVGTPGRLLDLHRQGHLKLDQVNVLVLDEADKMLDLGFLPDVERILRLTPPSRQTMLFSATMPGEIVTLARRHLNRPTHIRAEQHDEPAHVPTTQQHVFRAHQLDKIEVLARVLQAKDRGLTIVFSRTKRSADQVAKSLTTKGFAAAAVHGDLGQSQRERAMRAFRSGKVDVLVATDVAARGLDVDDVTHVINYECPEDEKAYLHRIGRTGRAGREGVAVTFVDWNDLHRWKTINDTLNLGIADPVETYSTSEHLASALNIAPDATGVLPAAQRGRLGLEAESLEDIGETGKVRSATRRPASGDNHARDGAQRTRAPRRRTRSGQPAERRATEAARDHAATAAADHAAAADRTAAAAADRTAAAAAAADRTAAAAADRTAAADHAAAAAAAADRTATAAADRTATAAAGRIGAADHATAEGDAVMARRRRRRRSRPSLQGLPGTPAGGSDALHIASAADAGAQ
jgi:superfamily II DNA/RNA helicase